MAHSLVNTPPADGRCGTRGLHRRLTGIPISPACCSGWCCWRPTWSRAADLGATGAFGAVAAWLAGLFSPEHVAANLVHAKYWNDGAPLESWTLFLLIGAFVGALVSGIAGQRVKIQR